MFNHHAGLAAAWVSLGKRSMMGEMGNGHMMGGDVRVPDGEGNGTMELQLPGWFWLACLAVIVVFLPVMLFISYTLNSLLPTLAMIEDPAPPAYEPLSATDADDSEAAASASKPSVPVTSSLRKSTQMLRSISGFSSLFRGFWCSFVATNLLVMAQGFFASLIPTTMLASIFAPLPAVLVTLPLFTAWVHIVMSAPRSVSWWHRIPSMRKTFTALWRPAMVMWGAIAITTCLPKFLLYIFGVYDAAEDPSVQISAWKVAVPSIVGLVLALVLVIPANVLFTRCQASLLPLEDDPIIAFDRSFGGVIEPDVVGGRGYATLADAWHTFSRAAWMRLVKLYVKILAFTFATWIVIAAIMVPIFILAKKNAVVVPGDGN